MRVSLTVIAGPAKGRAFTFDEPDRFLFGRAVDARVSLPDDPYVSRQHFLLEVAPPDCKVTDLDSKNGLFVNDVRFGGRKAPAPGMIQAPGGATGTLLKNGDTISVGDTLMSIAIELDVFCVECAEPIPEGDRDELALLGGTHLCRACRTKQRTQGSDQQLTLSMPRISGTQPMRLVFCVRCRKDVTGETGVRGQHKDAVYVCKDCRQKEMADPRAVLDEVLGLAARGRALPGAPAIQGYRIERELGRGGMGAVYQATQNSSGRRVAIKTMLPDVPTSERAIRTFQREVEVTRQLKHENIVQLLDYGQAWGTFFFVLEFVDGMDLEKYLEARGGFLSLEEAAPLMLETLAGLGHAHHAHLRLPLAGGGTRTSTGSVHRDLKPQNILLAKIGSSVVPKVADFGLAKSFEAAGLTDMTAPGQLCGTPIYWPREQITHYRYLAPPTDVFSIAAVFYEMLTGRYMRDGFPEMLAQCQERGRCPGIPDFMRVIAGNRIAPLRTRCPTVPDKVAAVIDRAVREAEVPADETRMRSELAELRYPDAAAFADALRQALRETGIAP
jgi:serine/threonine protein kinase